MPFILSAPPTDEQAALDWYMDCYEDERRDEDVTEKQLRKQISNKKYQLKQGNGARDLLMFTRLWKSKKRIHERLKKAEERNAYLEAKAEFGDDLEEPGLADMACAMTGMEYKLEDMHKELEDMRILLDEAIGKKLKYKDLLKRQRSVSNNLAIRLLDALNIKHQ